MKNQICQIRVYYLHRKLSRNKNIDPILTIFDDRSDIRLGYTPSGQWNCHSSVIHSDPTVKLTLVFLKTIGGYKDEILCSIGRRWLLLHSLKSNK